MKTKNSLFLIAVSLLASNYLSAQITLTQSSYASNLIGTDTLAYTKVITSFPTLTSMTNASWDMTSVSDTSFYGLVRRVPTSTYEFADSNYYLFGPFLYQGNEQYSVTSSGLQDFGIVIPRTAYSLTSYTGGVHDSLIINKQNSLNSNPANVIGFPATYNGSWSSNYERNFDCSLTVAAFSYNNAPTVVKLYVKENDTVKGWGQMRDKNLASVVSPYFDVLQVQTTINAIDSFFINGSPAPTAVLNAFGFTQGMITVDYYQSYFRAGAVTPLAQVSYKNASFSAPTSATTMISDFTAGIANIATSQSSNVYPNPAGSQITITVSGNSQSNHVAVYDISGRMMGTYLMRNDMLNISTQSFNAGMYFYKIYDNGGAQLSTGRFSVVK
ncbi:MAG TPA: T9SS type A sorting domain-containing protein [Bacteroidia bacterium]|nr:T9SS type A sorting domain-containing protein [Bacteroidia bacterium]